MAELSAFRADSLRQPGQLNPADQEMATASLGQRSVVKMFGTDTAVPASSAFNLQQAAEELSFSRSQAVESKTFKQRVLKSMPKPKVLAQEEISAVLKAMHDEASAHQLKQFGERLVAMLKARKSVREFLRGSFSDPTKCYLAVSYAITEARNLGLPGHEIEQLHDLLADLQAEQGSSIRAGLNTIEAAGEFGANAQTNDQYRQVYRDAVVGYESFARALDSVLTQFGDEQFDKGVALLLKGLAADLNSDQPSLEPQRLHAILQDVYQLEAVSTVMSQSRNILNRLGRANELQGVSPTAFTRDILHLANEPYVSAYSFADLARKNGVNEREPQVAFFSMAMAVLRGMPPKAFPHNEARLKSIDAAQAALDAILLDESETT